MAEYERRKLQDITNALSSEEKEIVRECLKISSDSDLVHSTAVRGSLSVRGNATATAYDGGIK